MAVKSITRTKAERIRKRWGEDYRCLQVILPGQRRFLFWDDGTLLCELADGSDSLALEVGDVPGVDVAIQEMRKATDKLLSLMEGERLHRRWVS